MFFIVVVVVVVIIVVYSLENKKGHFTSIDHTIYFFFPIVKPTLRVLNLKHTNAVAHCGRMCKYNEMYFCF